MGRGRVGKQEVDQQGMVGGEEWLTEVAPFTDTLLLFRQRLFVFQK